MKLRHFLAELRRRNVYKAVAAYIIAAWLVIQFATQVFPFFEIPTWMVRLVILLFVICTPLAVILPWVYEITPAGIKQAEHFCDALHASKESLVRRKQVVLWIALAFRFLYFLVFGHCVFNGLKSEGEKSVKINR